MKTTSTFAFQVGQNATFDVKTTEPVDTVVYQVQAFPLATAPLKKRMLYSSKNTCLIIILISRAANYSVSFSRSEYLGGSDADLSMQR